MDMTRILKCNMSTCAYNMNNICHTPGINVGSHAECNTYTHGSSKGGFPEAKGGIGACLASECKFNEQLECRISSINVASHDRHADCETFQTRS
ncbi:MAG: DUF1540 domain-containing protein [Chloroflexi bacterium]|nr:DUF1540 domain-containing protein [Chloroflexota bacterium]MBI3040600.1 DUF1540 domain-containing protein [Chloroflexota bacterium]